MSNSLIIPILRVVRGVPYAPVHQEGAVLQPPLFSTYSTYLTKTGHSISGVLKVNGTLSKRRVSLLFRDSLLLIDSVFSDETTGIFKFENLNKNYKYLVIADDSNQTYNAVVADWVQIYD